MSILKGQVDSSPNFVSLFSCMKDYSSVFFLTQTIYTFLYRSPLKWKSLRLSIARVKFCQIPYVNFETTSRFLSKFYIPLQFHERLLLCTFLAQTIYTLLIRSPLKWKSLRLLSALLKICQIPYANSKTTSRFLSKFCIPLQLHERLFLCTFLAQIIYTFSSSGGHYSQKLRSKFAKFFM